MPRWLRSQWTDLHQNFGIGRQVKGLDNIIELFWFFKVCCYGNQLKSKTQRFSRTNLLCRAAIRKRIAILQFRFRTVHHNEFLYIVYNFGDIRSRNPRVHDVNNSTFCSHTAKIGVLCQISQNILDRSWLILYRFVKRISRDDFPSIRLAVAVAQGTLLWQPVKYGRRSQTSCATIFTLCFGIRKRIGRSQICFQGVLWQ